jgi:hypothetical protein
MHGRISHWPSSHLVNSTDQCFFMSYEEMHLLFYVMKKCIRNFPLAILVTIFSSSHFNQSCLFMSYEKKTFASPSCGEMYGESSKLVILYGLSILALLHPKLLTSLHISNLNTLGLMTFESTQINKIFSQLFFWKVMPLQFLKRFYGNLYPLKYWRRWSHLNQTQKGPLMWHKGFLGCVHFNTSFDNDDEAYAIILRSTPNYIMWWGPMWSSCQVEIGLLNAEMGM